jgi:hypothetical protein
VRRVTKRAHRGAIAMGVVSLFDVTGVIIYRITRHALVAQRPEPSPSEPFRASARLIREAQRDVKASRASSR